MPAQPIFGPSALATPANAVTLLRIVGSVVLTVLVAVGVDDWSLALFIVLAASDNIDGVLARRQGPTRSGAFLDPLADKVLVGGVLVALALRAVVPWWLVVAILAREVAMSVYRSVLVRRGVSVPASVLGKVKTFVTLVGIGLVLIRGDGVRTAGLVVLYAALVLTWVSFADYLKRARHLSQSPAEPERQAADAG